MDIWGIIMVLLKNRGLDTAAKVREFFNPPLPQEHKLDIKIKSALQLIKRHIKKGSKIIIYGDYDVDGVCATAILWETLYRGYKNVYPHIPHRESEGYGLSHAGIDHCLKLGAKLLITVDSGIVAHEQVEYCRDQGCDVIIVDHHEPGQSLPDANVVVHTTLTCAAGLAWYFFKLDQHLDLVALAVICDMVPLLGMNRSFAKYGLEALNKTQRVGLKALFSEASLINQIEPYHVGFIIGPRLNAMGRLEHAIDSLRLLCTSDTRKAHDIARLLSETNQSRQKLTQTAVDQALLSIKQTTVLVSASKEYHQGIIGLVAAKLTEKHYRPAIAISIGETESKGSARSVPGFHITEHLRTTQHLLKNVGGHAMAAGFTIETAKLEKFTSVISSPDIPPDLLVKKQRVDVEIPLESITDELYTEIQKFRPFGLGNPQPIFRTNKIHITNPRRMGKDSQHVKFQISNFKFQIECVWFNAPSRIPGKGDIIYSLDRNVWNGQSTLQLVIKDVYV